MAPHGRCGWKKTLVRVIEIVVNGGRLVVNRRLGCNWGTLFKDLVLNRRHNGILVVNRDPFILKNFPSYFQPEFFWVTCCVEIKLQFFFGTYISICTICNVLIQLISIFLYDLRWAHGESNSWEKSKFSGTKMEQWSVTPLPIGRLRAVDNMASLFWCWHFENKAYIY